MCTLILAECPQAASGATSSSVLELLGSIDAFYVETLHLTKGNDL